MIILEANIPDVLIFRPKTHGDDRGFFMETFRVSYFRERGLNFEFVQDNHSFSMRSTLRGLHFQRQRPQGKLVRVLAGEVFDVAVDIRRSSPTFGRWVGEFLSSHNKKQLWVPPGFAHGFFVTSETADVSYKCTEYYDSHDEFSLLWNDPDVGVDWPIQDCDPLLSDRDKNASSLYRIPAFL